MGGGSSSPKLMEEVRINANDRNRETFKNKKKKSRLFFGFLGLSIGLVVLFLFFNPRKKRYKD